MMLQDLICMNCGHKFEDLVQKDALPKCPSCDADTLSIDLAVPKFHLKGSGWSHDGYTSGLYEAPKGREEKDKATEREYNSQFKKD